MEKGCQSESKQREYIEAKAGLQVESVVARSPLRRTEDAWVLGFKVTRGGVRAPAGQNSGWELDLAGAHVSSFKACGSHHSTPPRRDCARPDDMHRRKQAMNARLHIVTVVDRVVTRSLNELYHEMRYKRVLRAVTVDVLRAMPIDVLRGDSIYTAEITFNHWQLPLELWHTIVQFLPREGQRTVLLVSRSLHDIVLPLLFSHITIRFGLWKPDCEDPGSYYKYMDEEDLEQYHTISSQIMRRIAHEPDFARVVKVLSVLCAAGYGVETLDIHGISCGGHAENPARTTKECGTQPTSDCPGATGHILRIRRVRRLIVLAGRPPSSADARTDRSW
ncbi:hypothetical protein GY45DRAFT_1399634 [Cubamyces sp. BRFM 1775]|nr:hypothetical protein GY45DRAFT_1399634 [Cubamyces sp. BRFM 1775]